MNISARIKSWIPKEQLKSNTASVEEIKAARTYWQAHWSYHVFHVGSLLCLDGVKAPWLVLLDLAAPICAIAEGIKHLFFGVLGFMVVTIMTLVSCIWYPASKLYHGIFGFLYQPCTRDLDRIEASCKALRGNRAWPTRDELDARGHI